MKLVHVVPHINEEASGPSYSVPALCASLARQGHDVELMCLAAGRDIPGVRLSVHTQWQTFGRLAFSPGLADVLRARRSSAAIVHNHSLWAMPNMAAGLIVPRHGARLVTSPRGTLSQWALSRSKWMKRVLWPLQRPALFRADMLHATSSQEHDEIRAMGLRQAVAIIPNGVDIAPECAAGAEGTGQKTLLFLSRIHPKKGVDLLLSAWQTLQIKHPDWRLQIAGRGEAAHVRAAQQLAEGLALKRIDFSGPLYGAAKSKAYSGADLFVLPSHNENFGMVIAEALAHGLPVVASTGTPWAGLVEHGCGWHTAIAPDELLQTLDQAMSTSVAELREKGRSGRAWMIRDFSWDAVGAHMSEAYRWLIEGGEKPISVRL